MGVSNILRGNINHPQITHKKSIKKLLHYRGDILFISIHRIHVNLFADMRINIGCYLNTFVAEALLNTAGEI
ncbi:hypothetical protein DJ88_4079 [Bacillus paralicheniformis]|nr:hypothetical protein DJ88_4079 [Bacillus paralicheniformis]